MTHRYPSIVELVSSWQPSSYRDRLTREIADARQTGDTDHPNILGDTLHAAAAAVDALDALTAIHEFIILVDS